MPADTAVFCIEHLKIVGAWWQAGTPDRTFRRQLAHMYDIGVFLHRAHHIAQPTDWHQNPVHFRINRCMFLSQNLMMCEIGPLSL